jgi:hypothetical protein
MPLVKFEPREFRSWEAFMDLRLLLRAIPLAGKWIVSQVPEDVLYEQSLTFRLCLHFLL